MSSSAENDNAAKTPTRPVGTRVCLIVDCEVTGEPGDFGTLANMASEALRLAIMADCDDADAQGRYLVNYTTGTVAMNNPRAITNMDKLGMIEDEEGGVKIGFTGLSFL